MEPGRTDDRESDGACSECGPTADGRTSLEASVGTVGWMDFESIFNNDRKLLGARIPWRPLWVRVGSSPAYKPRAWEAQRRPSAGFGRLPG